MGNWLVIGIAAFFMILAILMATGVAFDIRRNRR